VSVDLLVVTDDGFGKRTPVDRYRRTSRAALGVRTASQGAPLIAALLVTDADELVIASSAGKVERIAMTEVPRVGRTARGAKLIQLGDGERVTAAGLVQELADEIDVAAEGLSVDGPALRPGLVALRPGERFAVAAVLNPPAAPRRTGSRMAVPRDEWARTEVHKHSAYWCGHCGEPFGHPEDVAAHIEAAHAENPAGGGADVDPADVTLSGATVGNSGPRLCGCGCGTPLPSGMRGHARYIDATHRRRGARHGRRPA
jgi:DNA gyrase C-terminal domain, beta-propeller